MKHYLLLYISAIVLLSFSCNSEKQELENKINTERNKYQKAIELKDYEVAKNSIYSILAIDSNNHDYYDTLANLYFLTKDYETAKESAKKALAFNMNNKTLRVAYSSSLALKHYNDITFYGEKLLEKNPDSLQLAYEVAFNYIQQMNHAKAEEILNKIITNPKSLNVTYNEYRGNGVQNIPYRAASYNLLGFINSELNKNEIAKQMFKSALSVKEDYILAKENLEIIQSKLDTIQ